MRQKTRILKADRKEDLEVALALLRKGELVALPTETVYGLAANAKDRDAVKKIFIAKERPIFHPLIVHIYSAEKLNDWAKNIPPLAYDLAKKFWPGPLTLLLNKAESVDDIVTGGLPTIALRVPDHAVMLTLLKELDSGIAAPSANLHKKISPTTAEHVIAGLSDRIAAIVDAGPCTVGLESTILDLTTTTPKILRPGPITQEMLEDFLKMPVLIDTSSKQHVSGNMKIHYKPTTETLLMTLQEIEQHLLSPANKEKVFGLMCYTEPATKNNCKIIKKMPHNKNDYARLMYQALHELDAAEVHQILIQAPPKDSLWADVFDRLSKASAK